MSRSAAFRSFAPVGACLRSAAAGAKPSRGQGGEPAQLRPAPYFHFGFLLSYNTSDFYTRLKPAHRSPIHSWCWTT
jgi:hypothetical protein